MKIVTLIALLICLLETCPAQGAQSAPVQSPPADKMSRSQETQAKIHQVDLLVSILPLVLTKDQIKDILLTLEKVRAKQQSILASEDDEILKLDKEVDDTLTLAITKDQYPPRVLQNKVFNVTRALSLRRQVAVNEYIDEVFTTLDKILNAGQKKAMAGSLDPAYFAPGVKADTLKDIDKIKAFIRMKLLDPVAYTLLVKLSK